MKRTLMLTAALLFAGNMAIAAVDTDAIVADLTAKGYTNIEVKTSDTRVKIEAVNGTEKLEVTYDIATGEIVKQETGTVGAGDEIDDDQNGTGASDSGDDEGDDHGDHNGDDDHDDDHDGGDNDGDGDHGGGDHGGGEGSGGGDQD